MGGEGKDRGRPTGAAFGSILRPPSRGVAGGGEAAVRDLPLPAPEGRPGKILPAPGPSMAPGRPMPPIPIPIPIPIPHPAGGAGPPRWT